MLYCDPCAEPRGWPVTMFRSHGRCECCGETRVCSDLPSSQLPLPPGVEPLPEGDAVRVRLSPGHIDVAPEVRAAMGDKLLDRLNEVERR